MADHDAALFLSVTVQDFGDLKSYCLKKTKKNKKGTNMKSINTLPALPSGMESRGCQLERANSQSLDSILRTRSWLRACGCNFGDVNPPHPPTILFCPVGVHRSPLSRTPHLACPLVKVRRLWHSAALCRPIKKLTNCGS